MSAIKSELDEKKGRTLDDMSEMVTLLKRHLVKFTLVLLSYHCKTGKCLLCSILRWKEDMFKAIFHRKTIFLCINYSPLDVLKWRIFFSFKHSSTVNRFFPKNVSPVYGDKVSKHPNHLKTSIQILKSFVWYNPSVFLFLYILPNQGSKFHHSSSRTHGTYHNMSIDLNAAEGQQCWMVHLFGPNLNVS